MPHAEPPAVLAGCRLSPGYGRGAAFLYQAAHVAGPSRRWLSSAEVPAEQQRFRAAVVAARHEVAEVRQRVLAEIGEAEADIIGAHLLLLEDRGFMARVERRIEADHANAEYAVQAEADAVAAKILDSKSDVLRERAHDVADVARRLIKHLGHGPAQALEHLPPNTVLIARELLPSDTLNLDRRHVAGLVLERGSPHGHAAILARAMGIPAVGSVEGALSRIRDGDVVLVDGEQGEVVVGPDLSQSDAFSRSRGRYDRALVQLAEDEAKLCATLDEHRVSLLANIGRPAEVEQVQGHRLGGVGLFRTEYLFLEAQEQPTVEAQRDVYRAVLDGLAGQPLTIRTFDFGADKVPQFLARTHSGLRGLGLALEEGSLLRSQVRAVIEATGEGHEVALLLPMVASATELERALELVDQVARSLGRARPRVGAMIETPSAVFEIDEILRVADFVSVGTNDLAHFMLGLERGGAGALGDEAVFQPSMLRALSHLADRAATHQRPITVCGEAAGHPAAALVLVGLGFRSLSMSPVRAVHVRSAIRRSRASALADVSRAVLRLGSRARVIEHVRAALHDLGAGLHLLGAR